MDENKDRRLVATSAYEGVYQCRLERQFLDDPHIVLSPEQECKPIHLMMRVAMVLYKLSGIVVLAISLAFTVPSAEVCLHVVQGDGEFCK